MASKALALVEPDPFLGTGTTLTSYIPKYGEQSGGNDVEKIIDEARNAYTRGELNDIIEVGRPIRGIVVKPNTHAFVQVLREDGSPVKVFNKLGAGPTGTTAGVDFSKWDALTEEEKIKAVRDGTKVTYPMDTDGTPAADASGDPASTAWTDWILQSVREQRAEKTQVVETFGDSYLYAFGERPRALEFRGVLMNTADYNWRAVFWENWDKFFRATKLVENNCRMYIGWDDIIVEGYPVNASAAEMADSPNALTFSFLFYVTNYINTAAQSNFLINKTKKMAVIRGGYDGNLIHATREFKYNDKRHRILDYIRDAGNAAYLAGGGEGGHVKNSQTVTHLMRTAQRTGWIALQSGPAAMKFLNNWLATTTFNTANYYAQATARNFEDKEGLERGEVNQWFGFLGAIAERTMPRNIPTSSNRFSGGGDDVDANWLGDPSKSYNFSDVVREGSLDGVIQGLGLATVNAAGLSGGVGVAESDAPVRSGKPYTATMIELGD